MTFDQPAQGATQVVVVPLETLEPGALLGAEELGARVLNIPGEIAGARRFELVGFVLGGELFQGKRYHAYITDGPWFHRTKTGKLLMLWSSYGAAKYATGQAVSTSGTLAGPWVQDAEPLWADDGGHPMLFHTFEGTLVMAIHQPNRRVERARFFEVDDSGDRLRIVREIGGGR